MKTNILLSNSDLAKNTNIPLTQVRRNAKEFLSPDPQARRRSGYTRKFDLNDGFRIFAGTHLVSVLGYSFNEARMILNDILPWADSVALLPEGNSRRSGIDKKIVDYEIRIIKDIVQGDFYYQVFGTLKRDTEEFSDKTRGKVIQTSSTVYSYEISQKGKRAFNLIGPELLLSKTFKLQTIIMVYLADIGLYGSDGSSLLTRWEAGRK